MHDDEMWQVYSANGEPIPGEGWSSALDNPEKTGSDKIVGVAVVFLYRVNSEGVLELLWQRRSDKVSRYPGSWDISAGGHINLGESLVEAAVREAHEEIGAEINVNDLRLVALRSFNCNRLAWVYAVDWTGRVENFHFDDAEVSEVRWVPFADTTEFRINYGKKPLRKDGLTFDCLGKWFEMVGVTQGE